jgi:hypothetical protein
MGLFFFFLVPQSFHFSSTCSFVISFILFIPPHYIYIFGTYFSSTFLLLWPIYYLYSHGKHTCGFWGVCVRTTTLVVCDTESCYSCFFFPLVYSCIFAILRDGGMRVCYTPSPHFGLDFLLIVSFSFFPSLFPRLNFFWPLALFVISVLLFFYRVFHHILLLLLHRLHHFFIIPGSSFSSCLISCFFFFCLSIFLSSPSIYVFCHHTQFGSCFAMFSKVGLWWQWLHFLSRISYFPSFLFIFPLTLSPPPSFFFNF